MMQQLVSWPPEAERLYLGSEIHREEVAGVEDLPQHVGHDDSPQLRRQLLQQLLVVHLCAERAHCSDGISTSGSTLTC